MALKAMKAQSRSRASGAARARHCPRVSSVVCHAQLNVDRREAMVLGAALLASPLALSPSASAAEIGARVLTVSQLGALQKADQRKEFLGIAESFLAKELTGEDAPLAVRLVLNSAATYDFVAKTGGMDGSIVNSPSLDPGCKALVARLTKVKAEIDAKCEVLGCNPISWADVLALAGKVASESSWMDKKMVKAAKGSKILAGFAAPFPVDLGRVDTTNPTPPPPIPQQGAPVQEIRDFLYKLGTKPGQEGGFLVPLPPFSERGAFILWCAAADDPAAEEERFAAASPAFAGWKRKYDISRGTLTRTEYEVDFAEYYSKLANLGAKFNPSAYLHPITLANVRL